jgi:membrane protein required for colicin V production
MGSFQVSKFDYIVLGLLLISAGVGFARGAVREVAAMAALVGAAVLAVIGLPTSAPVVRHVVHPAWLGGLAALLLVFVATYVVLRLLGAALAQRVQQTHVLGALDRTMGLLIGLVRGLVVLGALYLMFNAATPADLRPRWIVKARTWPLARTMGQALQAAAPRRFELTRRVRPTFDEVLNAHPDDRNATGEYDARARGHRDDQVEKAR